MKTTRQDEILNLIRQGTSQIGFQILGIREDALIMQMHAKRITVAHGEAVKLLQQLKKDGKIVETEDSRIIVKDHQQDIFVGDCTEDGMCREAICQDCTCWSPSKE